MPYFIDKLSEMARFAFRTISTKRPKNNEPQMNMPERGLDWVEQRNLYNIRASTRDNDFTADSRGRNTNANNS